MRFLYGRRRATALIGLAAMIGALGTTVGTANAAGPSGSVTPDTNLLDAQVVSVSITHDALPAGVFLAVTQCGNATAAGAGIATLDPTGADCVGAEGLGSTLQLVGFPAGGNAAGTDVTPLTLKKTGIGANNRQCLPVGGSVTLPCTVAAATATAAGAYTGAGAFQLSFPITYRPAPTASVSSVTGQTGTSAARSGNTINLTGSNWDDTPAATVTLQLCNTSGAACDAGGLTGVTASVTGGALTASGDVDASATTGARAIKVSENTGLSALVPITILGGRTILLAPNAGGANTNVTITGSGFDASSAFAVSGLDASFTPTTDTPGGGVTSSTGGVSTNFVVVDPNTKFIVVAELDSPSTDFAMSPFTFSGNECTPAGQTTGTGATTGGPDANASTNDGCSLLQNITQQINGGVLKMSQTDGQIAMSTITLNGTDQHSAGTINKVTVLDARGSLAGWVVNATLTDLLGPNVGNHHVIPASNMAVSGLTCAPQANSGVAGDVVAGAGGALDNSTALTLCTAATGGGGGTFDINGGLDLLVPASVAAGTYTGTLTITVS